MKGSKGKTTNYFVDILKSFSVQATTIGTIYLAGYFNISPAWLLVPLIFSMMRDQWKVKKELEQQIAIAVALRNEKELVLANIQQLPSWVYFPDVDRCEWINKILSQLWPNFCHNAGEIIKSAVEPNINKVFAMYKKESFTFQCLNLGSIPPRFGGIKVYDKNVSRNEIVVDVNLFHASDCDFSFSLLGFTGGIQNIQISGLLRFVIKPLITTVPFVGGIEIFFLYKPQVDFNLVGVADLLNMPGISGILQQTIDNLIASKVVLPNKIPIILNHNIYTQESNFPNPEGVLRVNVIEARDLVNRDISIFGKGKSDPYVIVNVGGEIAKSSIVENSLNPQWDFWAEFIIDSVYGDTVLITVMDKDDLIEDFPLGNLSLEINLVKEKGELDRWIQLEGTKKGLVHLCMFYFQLTSDHSDYNLRLNELPFLSSSVLVVYVDSAKNLMNVQTKQLPDSVVHLVVGNVKKISKIVLAVADPVFEESFTFLVHNPENDRLQLQLIDQKTKTKLGHLYFNLKKLLNCASMELLDQRYPLTDSATESTIVLSMRLRMFNTVNN